MRSSHTWHRAIHERTKVARYAQLRQLLTRSFPPGTTPDRIVAASGSSPPRVRKFKRLSDYNEEVALARIHSGFHYRFSSEVGKDMGRKIGQQLVATQLRGAEASAAPSR